MSDIQAIDLKLQIKEIKNAAQRKRDKAFKLLHEAQGMEEAALMLEDEFGERVKPQ